MERTYVVADEIDGASGTRLHSVHGDRVVIDLDGRLAMLWLPSVHDTGATARAVPP